MPDPRYQGRHALLARPRRALVGGGKSGGIATTTRTGSPAWSTCSRILRVPNNVEMEPSADDKSRDASDAARPPSCRILAVIDRAMSSCSKIILEPWRAARTRVARTGTRSSRRRWRVGRREEATCVHRIRSGDRDRASSRTDPPRRSSSRCEFRTLHNCAPARFYHPA